CVHTRRLPPPTPSWRQASRPRRTSTPRSPTPLAPRSVTICKANWISTDEHAPPPDHLLSSTRPEPAAAGAAPTRAGHAHAVFVHPTGEEKWRSPTAYVGA